MSSEPSSTDDEDGAGAGAGVVVAGAGVVGTAGSACEVTTCTVVGLGDGFAGTAVGGGVAAGTGEPAGTVGAPKVLATHNTCTCCHAVRQRRHDA